MSTHPLPFFSGSSILAWEQREMIVVAPANGNRFRSPAGTYELYLPASRTVLLQAEPLAQDGWSALVFHGEYSWVDRPNIVRLAPVRTMDARLFIDVLNRKLSLPLRPRSIRPHQLTQTGPSALKPGEYIRVVGQQSPYEAHCEVEDFSFCKLREPLGSTFSRKRGEFYLVTGFYSPGSAPDSGVVGYNGPTIAVTAIKPEPNGLPPPKAAYDERHEKPERPGIQAAFGLADERTHDQMRDLAFSGSLSDGSRIIAALHGSGAQSTSDYAVRGSQLALATLLNEPAYAPNLDGSAEPPAFCLSALSQWVSWVLDRSPLPEEPAERLRALALRIAQVLDEFNLRGACVFCHGVLVQLRGRVATLLGRGLGRAYLLRESQSQLLVRETTLGIDAEAHGICLDDSHRWIPTASIDLTSCSQAGIPCAEVELQPGDRLLLVVGEALLKALDGPAAVARLVAAFPKVDEGFPATAELHGAGWGLVLVDEYRGQ
jgi:hypothetical protein